MNNNNKFDQRLKFKFQCQQQQQIPVSPFSVVTNSLTPGRKRLVQLVSCVRFFLLVVVYRFFCFRDQKSAHQLKLLTNLNYWIKFVVLQKNEPKKFGVEKYRYYSMVIWIKNALKNGVIKNKQSWKQPVRRFGRN